MRLFVSQIATVRKGRHVSDVNYLARIFRVNYDRPPGPYAFAAASRWLHDAQVE